MNGAEKDDVSEKDEPTNHSNPERNPGSNLRLGHRPAVEQAKDYGHREEHQDPN